VLWIGIKLIACEFFSLFLLCKRISSFVIFIYSGNAVKHNNDAASSDSNSKKLRIVEVKDAVEGAYRKVKIKINPDIACMEELNAVLQEEVFEDLKRESGANMYQIIQFNLDIDIIKVK